MADMYDWDKPVREDKSGRNTQIPSFSSTLLDEIYRSIDGGEEQFGEFKLRNQKPAKEQSVKSGGGRGRFKKNNDVEDEEIASFRRACLVDKWMEMKGNEKITTNCLRPREIDAKLALDNDPLFFSSGSSSSDSSFGWYTEAESVKPKQTCFAPLNKPKQVKTSPSAVKRQNDFHLFDDDKTNPSSVMTKNRALKIYISLKKVKQPISPGGRLTTFLNAIFTNGHSKKRNDLGFENKSQTRSERGSKPTTTNVSTCSSASSFSRSCLSKDYRSSREHHNNRRSTTVRFPNYDQEDYFANKFARARTEKQDFKGFSTKYDDEKFDFDDEEEDDEMASDSSSDLFDLDHLVIFKNEQFCEELPVYETTHLGTNRAIASGLI